MREVGSQLYKNEGMFWFWKGVHVIAAGCIPAHACFFSSYELAKSTFKLDDGEMHWTMDALVGATATLFHDMFLTPSDMAKQRMQLNKHLWFVKLVKEVYKHEGLSAMFWSYRLTVLMNMPNAAIIVTTNENLKVLFKPE